MKACVFSVLFCLVVVVSSQTQILPDFTSPWVTASGSWIETGVNHYPTNLLRPAGTGGYPIIV